MAKSRTINLLKVPGAKKRDFYTTHFTGFVVDPFEFSILMKDDGSVWHGTGSIEWHMTHEKSEHWDNPKWMNNVLKGDKKALKEIPKEAEKYKAELFEVLRIAKIKGWI